jgi:transcriptional regulator with XRE-family HTH domain
MPMQLTDQELIDDLEERVSRESAPDASLDLVPVLGANLRRLRVKRGLSLERLSALSGVSRAMLSQVELGYSAPTINVVWRIANALDVPFSALLTQSDTQNAHVLRLEQAKVLSSNDGAFTSRALFPVDSPRRTEFYELRLAAGASERAEAHAPGTTENLVVVQGTLQVTVAHQEPLELYAGDAVLFTADEPHVYANRGKDDALIYLVMNYALVVG